MAKLRDITAGVLTRQAERDEQARQERLAISLAAAENRCQKFVEWFKVVLDGHNLVGLEIISPPPALVNDREYQAVEPYVTFEDGLILRYAQATNGGGFELVLPCPTCGRLVTSKATTYLSEIGNILEHPKSYNYWDADLEKPDVYRQGGHVCSEPEQPAVPEAQPSAAPVDVQAIEVDEDDKPQPIQPGTLLYTLATALKEYVDSRIFEQS